jgi:RNA polymerase sigma-54 factor
MSGKLGQSQKMLQTQVMTPELQQAIKMLTLTHMEMTDLIAQELVENPLLEESNSDSGDAESGDAPSEQSEDHEGSETFDGQLSENTPETLKSTDSDDHDWDSYLEPYSDASPTSAQMSEKFDSDDLPDYENMVTRTESLAEHLEWQLKMEHVSLEELEFGIHIVHSLNEEGFLEIDWKEIALQKNLSESAAHKVIKLIQRFDPIGCATSGSKESLIVQAEELMATPYALIKVIENHLEDIYKKNYDVIQKKLQISLDEIKEIELLLGQLNPRPGRQISTDEARYITPDLYVKQVGDELVLEINNDGIPDLKISNAYRSILKNKSSDSKSKEFVKDKLRGALWLMKSIENRQRTIEKVALAILKFQPEFFKRGPQYLRPMILKDVASEIGMHESTVSRVTTNKYIHTHMGVYELKYFFNSGVGGYSSSDGTTGELIKYRIKQLIDQENGKAPLSDEKLVLLLNEMGIEIARRTVAKYRDELGFLSSSKRKKN